MRDITTPLQGTVADVLGGLKDLVGKPASLVVKHSRYRSKCRRCNHCQIKAGTMRVKKSLCDVLVDPSEPVSLDDAFLLVARQMSWPQARGVLGQLAETVAGYRTDSDCVCCDHLLVADAIVGAIELCYGND